MNLARIIPVELIPIVIFFIANAVHYLFLYNVLFSSFLLNKRRTNKSPSLENAEMTLPRESNVLHAARFNNNGENVHYILLLFHSMHKYFRYITRL